MRAVAMARTTVILLAALALASCNAPEEPATQKTKPATASNPLALTAEELSQEGITLETVQPQSVKQTITLTGTIVPNQNTIAKVAPRLPGRIAEVRVGLGEHVKAAQTLAVLESIELGEAHAAYHQAKSEASLAEASLDRATQLTVEDIVPKKDYLRAKADAERAQAALAAAADTLRLLGVAPGGADSQQRDAAYPLIAPFTGTIIEKKAVRGELAKPDESLFTVADLSMVWVEADVYEQDLATVNVGMPARITVAAYPDREFSGELTYLADTMDTATRTVKARISVPNADRTLKPGMFATGALVSSASARALVVPEQAVMLLQGQTAVFVATDKGFAARAVETRAAADGRVRITSGLAPGERIAASGVYALKARLLKSQLGTED